MTLFLRKLQLQEQIGWTGEVWNSRDGIDGAQDSSTWEEGLAMTGHFRAQGQIGNTTAQDQKEDWAYTPLPSNAAKQKKNKG